jgi:hypothetical protein
MVHKFTVPLGTICKQIALVGDNIVALMDIPDRGIVPFIYCPATGLSGEIILKEIDFKPGVPLDLSFYSSHVQEPPEWHLTK